MSEQLDELFAKIRNGKKFLSAEEVACVAADFTRVKTEKLLLEELEDFKDRSKEDEEWEAFHAREYKKQTLEDLRQSRLMPYVMLRTRLSVAKKKPQMISQVGPRT